MTPSHDSPDLSPPAEKDATQVAADDLAQALDDLEHNVATLRQRYT
ncbi:MAG: hypothetical protein F6K29_34700, partial [Okeania sp. SIO2G5]|nr:hypothetical protein [Okeania sp. SIO2G5]